MNYLLLKELKVPQKTTLHFNHTTSHLSFKDPFTFSLA